MLKARSQIVLLIAVTLGIFCPSVFAEFCSIDDVEMVSNYRQMQGWSFKSIFYPGVSGGLYYRPVVATSFLIDKYLHGVDPVFMHLGNILIHVLNVILVYFFSRQLVSRDEKRIGYLPFLTALCFGLHPITTEAVNWISARTDLLAGTFILTSAILLVEFKQSQKRKYLILSSIAFLFGVLSKEVAVAFLVGGFFILISQQETDPVNYSNAAPIEKGSVRKGLAYLLSGVCVIFLFFQLRTLAFTTNYNKIGMTLKFLFVDVIHTMFVFLRAFGFYLKKIFIPYPLNFAIMEVDPLYELFAIPLVLLCIYIASRKQIVSALFITGVFLITPAFVIAFNQIAWTPYAERYLYLPSAFIVAAVVFYLDKKLSFLHNTFKRVAILVVLAVMALSTVNRNFIWQTNLALCKDTVEKSPEARDVRIVYGCLLANNGDYEQAMEQLVRANSIRRQIGYDEKAELAMATIMYSRGNVEESVKMNEAVLDKSRGTSTKAINALIAIYENESKKTKKLKEQIAFNKKVTDYKSKLDRLNGKNQEENDRRSRSGGGDIPPAFL